MAAGCLNVVFSKHEFSLLQVLHVGLKGGVHLVNFLVHKAQFEVDCGDLGVVLANTRLENVKSSV